MRLIFASLLLFTLVGCDPSSNCPSPFPKPEWGLFSSTNHAAAKRISPKPVTPVFIDSIKFLAPDSSMGYGEARSKNTNSLIWRKPVYTVSYDNNLEKDVQDVFIDSMIVKCNYLFIRNEEHEVYKINLKTLKTIKL